MKPHTDKNTGKPTVFRNTASVTLIMLLSNCLGFVRQAAIAAYFGTNHSTDIYFTSSDFMRGISSAFTASLTTAVVAVYIKLKMTENRENANRTANRVMSMFLLFSAVAIAVLLLAAPVLSRVLAPMYDTALSAQLTHWLRVFSVTFFFAAAESSFAAILNANHIFIPGKLYGLIYNPVIIVFMMALSGKWGLNALLMGFLCANVIQIGVLAFCSRKYFKFQPASPFRDPHVKEILLLALPLLLSNLLVQCNGVVDKMICSMLGEGTQSAYSYANTLEQFVTASVTVSVGLVLFSKFSEFAARKETRKMEHSLLRSCTLLLLLLLPIGAIVLGSAADIVGAVYLRGQFTSEAARNTAMALIGFGIGFPVVGVRELLIRAHFSYEDTKMPMLASIAGVVLNAAFSFLGAYLFGIFGVTLATSLSAVVTCVILGKSVKRYLPELRYRRVLPELLKMLFAAAICTVPVFLLARFLPGAFFLRFLAEAAAGLLVYEGVLLLLDSRANRMALKKLQALVPGRKPS